MGGDQTASTFRILGPVQVLTATGPVSFPRPQQRDLLAFLLLHADRTVAIDQVIDAMWGEAVPNTARRQIPNMLSALRAALVNADRPLATVDRKRHGYRLRMVDGTLDAVAFRAEVGRAHAASAPDTVAHHLRLALALWDGDRALAGVRAAFAAAARTRLAAQRDNAYERLFDVELERGRHAEITTELTAVVDANPTRERFVAQLMLALYRGGRPLDALDLYRRTRHTLVADYGLEPGGELRELERLILRRDPVLRRPAGRTPGHVRAGSGRLADPPVPAQLPADVRSFAGRGTEMVRLDAILAPAPAPAPGPGQAAQARGSRPGPCRRPAAGTASVVVLTGMAGVGKTALAVRWAHRAAHRFPDGQLYLDLRGYAAGTPVAADRAVAVLLAGLGVPADLVPREPAAAVGLYRSVLAGKRALVILDNARDAEQVRPLLPGGATGVLVTSRDRLAGLVATHDAESVAVDPLPPTAAIAILAAVLGTARVTADPAGAADLARACVGLPLALRIAAVNLAAEPTRPIADYVAALRANDVLAGLAVDGDPGSVLRTAFDHSYVALEPTHRRVFRRIGLASGPELDLPTVAALASIPVAAAERTMARLVAAHLVRRRASGRYDCHDLLWRYARYRAHLEDSAVDRATAVDRMRSTLAPVPR